MKPLLHHVGGGLDRMEVLLHPDLLALPASDGRGALSLVGKSIQMMGDSYHPRHSSISGVELSQHRMGLVMKMGPVWAYSLYQSGIWLVEEYFFRPILQLWVEGALGL